MSKNSQAQEQPVLLEMAQKQIANRQRESKSAEYVPQGTVLGNEWLDRRVDQVMDDITEQGVRTERTKQPNLQRPLVASHDEQRIDQQRKPTAESNIGNGTRPLTHRPDIDWTRRRHKRRFDQILTPARSRCHAVGWRDAIQT